MSTIRSAFLAGFCAAIPCFSAAIPFDNSSSTAPAVAVVGTVGDYLTLKEAATAFSALSSVNRPWILQIASDTTESAGCHFGASFGANGSLTITAAPGTTPTVTFTNTDNPTGWDGHLVLGAKNGTVINMSSSPASTGRFTIDGCATPGGTARDLTIQAGSPSIAIASASEFLLTIVGNTDGVTVRNVNLGMHDTNGFGGAVGLIAVQLLGSNLTPDNATIRNCGLVARGTGNSSGVVTTEVNGGGLATGFATQGLLVEDCDIAAPTNGLLFLRAGASQVIGCDIVVAGATNTGPSYSGINFQDANETVGWATVLRRNTIRLSAPSHATAIALTPGGNAAGTFIVDNNVVAAVDITGLTTPQPIIRRGIHAVSGKCNYHIEHNSIDIADQANISIGSQNQIAGITLTAPIETPRTATIRNNIVRNAQQGFGATPLAYASWLNTTSDGNCLFGLDAVGWMGAIRYATLSTWQFGGSPAGFMGFDQNGQSVDPAATTPPWDSELHFPAKPVAGLATVPSSTMLEDIDGDPRPSTGALPGADEPTTPTSVPGWIAYE